MLGIIILFMLWLCVYFCNPEDLLELHD